jgi:uncharacterized membrane protein
MSAATVDRLRTSFGFPAAVAMLLGLVAGLGLPALDDGLGADVPLFDFAGQDAARSMLETIAMATVSVAGIAFSITVVAFTLSASQLSPRVLRSFRRDLISQLTLAGFLGTFVYCVAALTRLGALDTERAPSISLAVAVILALGSLGLFALFIGHIVSMLQPSSVIASIAADARTELERPFPGGAGDDPEQPQLAGAEAEAAMAARQPVAVTHPGEGYLSEVHVGEIVELAADADALVRQRCRVGDYVLPGLPVAELWVSGEADAEALAERVAAHFATSRQRSLPQDPGFPIRQLADVALKGLSPGVNDPTTASNAIEAMTAGLIRFTRSEPPEAIRVDAAGSPRFIADAPDLDDLVRLGFRQVSVFADPDPTVAELIRDRLGTLREVAVAAGAGHAEIDRLLAKGSDR